MTPTDERAADLEERFVDARQSFTTDSQATKPMQPCDGSLHHPARFTQTTAVLGSASRDLRANTSDQQCQPMWFRVIATVSLYKFGFALGSATFASNGRNRIYQRQQLRHVVTIGLGQDYRKGNALRVRKEVMLRAGTTAIGWVRSRFFPAPTARMEELSAIARLKSTRSTSRSLDNSSRCRRSHTPVSCQSLSRRQQLDPLPQPISRGNMFQGIPERNTNRIPVSAARSGTGMRPGYFLRRGLAAGSKGLISSQSSSSISGFGIAPLTGKQCQS